MRPIIFALCVSAAACSGQVSNSPTSPTSVTFGQAQTPAQGGGAQTLAQNGTQLPFSGSYTAHSTSTFIPPATLRITGSGTGTATELGLFTSTIVDVVDTTASTGTGTFNFTAANGDQLFTTTAGGEDAFIPPNVSRTSLVATIAGGTGRFAAATGTLTIHATTVIDFATATSSSSGSFEGHINLNK